MKESNVIIIYRFYHKTPQIMLLVWIYGFYCECLYTVQLKGCFIFSCNTYLDESQPNSYK